MVELVTEIKFWALCLFWIGKVLIAAGISMAVGQLTKPVTSVILYGKEFDFKAVVQAGGFPSSHSSVSPLLLYFYYCFAQCSISKRYN